MATTLGVKNPYRYRGYLFDTETGLYYLQSRYYNPEIGRFINSDEIINSETGSILTNNMYAYCLNNPANMIDSDGKFAITLTGIGLIAGGMAIIGSFYAGSRWYAKKTVNLPSHKKIKVNIDHILNNHTVNGQGGPQKDKFPVWMKAKLIESIVRNAYKNGDKVKSQGDNIFMRGPGFGDSIIEMWVNKITKTIETAWPKLPK